MTIALLAGVVAVALALCGWAAVTGRPARRPGRHESEYLRDETTQRLPVLPADPTRRLKPPGMRPD